MIIMKKLSLPELKETWQKIAQIMKERNKKHGKLSEKDIRMEVAAYRNSK